ncbi:MAG: rRNA pseudouridine synthase [Candidatus Zixiibacteriota bacterium]|nr:MAG: rRNA pseudouridine synthase [candidate division Zixibacteria bacterium]
MRLNKFLSKAGIVSRRGADQLIQQGRITVNGKIIMELGTIIDETADKVEFEGKPVTLPCEYIYLVLNKPPGYLVTLRDNFGRPVVMSLMGKYKEAVKPVGRLDFDSSGLLILTNDGEFAFRLSHPRFEIDKKYLVKCEGFISDDDIKKLGEGIELEDGKTSPAKLELISRSKTFSRFHITIHEGRKRQIRRMCQAVGKNVVKLERISIGNIELGDLKSGKYRLLDKREIDSLKKALSL